MKTETLARVGCVTNCDVICFVRTFYSVLTLNEDLQSHAVSEITCTSHDITGKRSHFSAWTSNKYTPFRSCACLVLSLQYCQILGLHVTEMAWFDWKSMEAFPVRSNNIIFCEIVSLDSLSFSEWISGFTRAWSAWYSPSFIFLTGPNLSLNVLMNFALINVSVFCQEKERTQFESN